MAQAVEAMMLDAEEDEEEDEEAWPPTFIYRVISTK